MEKTNRIFTFEIRAENDTEHGDFITGRPIVYGSQTNIGPFDEIIDKGALDNTDLRDVALMLNHDMSKLCLARSRRNNANSTMQMSIDDMGMVIRANLDTENNMDARALYSAIKRGDVSGMSFAFGVDGEEWENLETDHPTRHIRSISKVLELSCVNFPAYEATSVEARSDVKALESARQVLDNTRREHEKEVREMKRKKLELRLKLLEV